MDERRSDLVAAATDLFLRQGYEGATLADIGAAAGVTRSNIYWYFKSKDEVFAAVMEQMLSREIRALATEHAGLDPLSRLARGLVDMRFYRPLHQAMHDRLLHSEAVRVAHDAWLEWMRQLIDELLDERGADVDRTLVTDIVLTVFEGANVPGEHRRPAHEMIRFIMESVLAKPRHQVG
jgi:AcrR family transcriptional regulator